MQLIDDINDLKPGDRGVYLLLIYLEKKKRIRVGRLGVFDFPAGWYVYAGSAMGGLAGRLKRHLSREKKVRWHVDYLLRHAEVRRVEIILAGKKQNNERSSKSQKDGERLECRTNSAAQSAPGATMPVPRFGSSDCRCASHLTCFEKTDEERLSEKIRTAVSNHI